MNVWKTYSATLGFNSAAHFADHRTSGESVQHRKQNRKAHVDFHDYHCNCAAQTTRNGQIAYSESQLSLHLRRGEQEKSRAASHILISGTVRSSLRPFFWDAKMFDAYCSYLARSCLFTKVYASLCSQKFQFYYSRSNMYLVLQDLYKICDFSSAVLFE